MPGWDKLKAAPELFMCSLGRPDPDPDPCTTTRKSIVIIVDKLVPGVRAFSEMISWMRGYSIPVMTAVPHEDLHLIQRCELLS